MHVQQRREGSLAGGPVIGHYHGFRSGHALTNALLRSLFADRAAWRYAAPEAGSASPSEADWPAEALAATA